MNEKQPFKCHCGDWPFRNAHFIVDDIRKDVCRDLPFYGEIEGKKYCVLHYPHKSKAADFQKVLKERIAADLWDFRMAYFPQVFQLKNKTLAAAADFSHATFAEGVNLTHCQFRADFDFWDSHFLDDSYFTLSDFHKQINFNNAEFKWHGDFAGVTFHEQSFATFNGTHFKTASFGSAKFHCEARFSESEFKESLDFGHAELFSKADFKGVSLTKKGKAQFDDVKFHKSANFENADFGKIDFTTSKFAADQKSPFDNAIFKNCHFRQSASFSGAEFYAEADFSNSKFTDAHFEGVTFSSKANFHETSFSGDVFFNATKFGYKDEHRIKSSHAIFDGVSFGKNSRVFFDDTWFSWHTSFDYAKFDGYVFFKGSENNAVFDTVFERRAFWSLLKILNATFDRPDKVYFRDVRLRPSWFANVTAELRKFNFTNIEWTDEKGRFITVQGEVAVVEKLTKHHSRRLLAIVFRQLADNAESNSRFEEASLFRRLSMETEWLEKKHRLGKMITNLDVAADKLKERFGKPGAVDDEKLEEPTDILGLARKSDGFFVHLLYRFTSYYGESWMRAFIVLSAIVFVIFPLIYMYTEFELCPKDKPVTVSVSICESKDAEVKKICECWKGRLAFGEAVVHSLTTATLQSVDYRKPVTRKGETAVILEKILAPLQAALLALALRRKFMR